MNPYLIIAAMLAIAAAGAGGFKLGADHELAAQAREDKHVQAAVAAANDAAAAAIANIKPKYTTINNEVQHEVVTKLVYSECRHSPDGLRLANQALNGGDPVTPGGGQLPKANTAR